MARRSKQSVEQTCRGQLSLQFADGSPLCFGLPGEVHEQRHENRKTRKRDEAWDNPAFCMVHDEPNDVELDKEKDSE